jgi:4-coumarate--CoA ligase
MGTGIEPLPAGMK